jgi:GntR family transcriptional regulator / MocR family aminotransferase
MSRRTATELALHVDLSLGRRAGVEAALRDAIRDGRLRVGDPLPSTRSLAADLGVSRATVVAAYEQLAAEGYATGEVGSATRVAEVGAVAHSDDDPNPLAPELTHDFHPGRPDVSAFPRRDWQRAVRRIMNEAPDDVFGYPHPRGRPELRRALAGYLSRARSVVTDPSAISIVGGFVAALSFVGEHLARCGRRRIAVEDPMLFFHRDVLRQAGVECVPVPVDGDGLRVDLLDRLADSVDAVLVCPAHQYPIGATLPAERRTALVDWARRHDAWVVEDDYDGEFRYDRRPVGALQGLAPDRVIHVGTASKTLAPGLRLAWITAPASLRRGLIATINVRAGVSALEQLAFADLIEHGVLDRQVRILRPRYRERRDRLRARLDELGWIDTPDGAAGLNLCARFVGEAAAWSDRTIVAECAERSVSVIELSRHYAVPDGAPNGLVLGFGAPPEHAFDASLDTLIVTLEAVAARRRP